MTLFSNGAFLKLMQIKTADPSNLYSVKSKKNRRRICKSFFKRVSPEFLSNVISMSL